jgi:hypothetical protein
VNIKRIISHVAKLCGSEKIQTFRRKILTPSSGLKSKGNKEASKKQVQADRTACGNLMYDRANVTVTSLLLVYCLAYNLTMKMEAISYSETFEDVY